MYLYLCLNTNIFIANVAWREPGKVKESVDLIGSSMREKIILGETQRSFNGH